MSRDVDAIIFDAGGVLLYIHEYRRDVAKRVLKSRGYQDNAINSALESVNQFDSDYLESNPIVNWHDEKQWLMARCEYLVDSLLSEAELLGYDSEQALVDQLFHLTLDAFHYRLYDETHAVLQRLQSRYRLFVLSNATASLDWALDLLGLRPYFEGVMISSYEQCVKPDCQIYHRAIQTFAITPETTLFIDDRIENVLAARACGLRGFHLHRGDSQDLTSVAASLMME